jgi:hypothetical protein
MQPRKSKLPLILGTILAFVLLVGCGIVLIGAGVIAWLVPSRVTTSMPEIAPIEATVDFGTDVGSTPGSSLSGLPINDVRVEFGVGSPAAIEVVASGEWPSTCAQLEQANVQYNPERQIQVELLINADAYNCEVGQEGLPVSLRIPLNMVEMPAGKYSVNVNGVQSDFEWQDAPSDPDGHFPAQGEYSTENLLPITLLDAHMEIGIGSPLPVELAVSGEFPNLCAQLAQVNSDYANQRFTFELLATPADPACPPDLLGLPFALRIPLNMVAMQPGTYTVSVNGLQTQVEWPPASTAEPITGGPLRMAYIGTDGNVILVDSPENLPLALTTDATPLTSPDPLSISYNEPILSSDGRFLAYRRGESFQQGDGTSMGFSLVIVDLTTFETKQIYEKSPAGFSWQPGTHALAYAQELDPNYFTNRADPPNADLANYIVSYDADTGESSQLVSPEHGYGMVSPVWSQDGRFLSFDEVLYMEGRGPFAYYDFITHEYVPLEQPLGIYSWSPDGEYLAYDNLTYTSQGSERIFIRARQGGSASEFSPKLDSGYAIMPAFSPQGDRIAYLLQKNGPDSQRFTLVVQPYPQGEPQELGEFDSVYMLNWSPDGSRIIFGTGVWGDQRIFSVDAESGASQELGKGMQPSVSLVP